MSLLVSRVLSFFLVCLLLCACLCRLAFACDLRNFLRRCLGLLSELLPESVRVSSSLSVVEESLLSVSEEFESVCMSRDCVFWMSALSLLNCFLSVTAKLFKTLYFRDGDSDSFSSCRDMNYYM